MHTSWSHSVASLHSFVFGHLCWSLSPPVRRSLPLRLQTTWCSHSFQHVNHHMQQPGSSLQRAYVSTSDPLCPSVATGVDTVPGTCETFLSPQAYWLSSTLPTWSGAPGCRTSSPTPRWQPSSSSSSLASSSCARVSGVHLFHIVPVCCNCWKCHRLKLFLGSHKWNSRAWIVQYAP